VNYNLEDLGVNFDYSYWLLDSRLTFYILYVQDVERIRCWKYHLGNISY
jgi:hypothetical protein